MQKFLALGPMPSSATPQDYLAAGPWCFAGQEQLFPDWEENFSFAPEPLVCPDALEQAAGAAIGLALRQIKPLAAILEPRHELFPEIYWQTLLLPWAICVASMLVERKLRCEAMIKAYGATKLTVPVLENCDINFLDEQDFVLQGELGQNYNQYIFSTLLAQNWPAKWEKIAVAPASNITIRKTPQKNRLKKILSEILLKLPFPLMKGMGIVQALKFSASLLHPCKTPASKLNFQDYSAQAFQKAPEIVIKNELDFFSRALPQSIRNLRHNPAKIRHRHHTFLRVGSIASYENASYRQNLAYWLASGNKLAYIQHGGNYGQAKVVCNSVLVEYSQDIFFTWGWKSHGKIRGNFQPMPSLQLNKKRNGWHGLSENLVFVGAEMAAFSYRLESRPTPLQFLNYRKAKALFLDACGEAIRQKTMYRPYFELPGLFLDGAWIKKKFPEVQLCRGPLAEHILKCRLLVLDHHGTTMLEALAWGIPLVLYWNRNFWPMTKECEDLLDELEYCGIWHDDPTKAAKKVREVWDNAANWITRPEVAQARARAANYLSLTVADGLDELWIQKLKNL